MAVQWGLTGGGGFGNALQMGMQMGMQAREAQDRREYRNALGAYASNPTREGLAGIAPHAPEFAIRENARYDQQAAAQQQKQQADLTTVRQLLKQAKTEPQKALAAARSLGVDLSQVPAADSPEFQPWVDQQLFIAEAMAPHEDKLPGIAQEIALIHKPGTPEFNEAFKQAINGKYGTDYYDPGTGAMRRRGVFDSGAPAGVPTTLPADFDFGEGGQPAQGSAPFQAAFTDFRVSG